MFTTSLFDTVVQCLRIGVSIAVTRYWDFALKG